MTEPIDQATIQAIDALTKQIAELMERLKQERNKAIDDLYEILLEYVNTGYIDCKLETLNDRIKSLKDKSHE